MLRHRDLTLNVSLLKAVLPAGSTGQDRERECPEPHGPPAGRESILFRDMEVKYQTVKAINLKISNTVACGELRDS